MGKKDRGKGKHRHRRPDRLVPTASSLLGPSVNGVVSICVQLPDRHDTDSIYCGRVAKVYVWRLGRWVPMCGQHRRAAVKYGAPVRPIEGHGDLRYAMPDE